MNEPIRIFSDLHLGHRVSRIDEVESLRPLISGAGTVIFNGDTWQQFSCEFLPRSTKMLAELEKICEEEGVTAIFLSGNHDPGWHGPGWVELAGGKIIITHGDAMLFDGSPWKREILDNEKRVLELWDEHPEAATAVEERLRVARKIAEELRTIDYPKGRHFLQRAWDAICPPRRAIRMLEGWLTQGETGARFCKTYFPRAEILIIGHFHHQGTWVREGIRTINTGSFMAPGRANWVEWHDGFLKRGFVIESVGKCRLGNTRDVWKV